MLYYEEVSPILRKWSVTYHKAPCYIYRFRTATACSCHVGMDP